MTKLVRLPDGTWINPDYVTGIYYRPDENKGFGDGKTLLWMHGDTKPFVYFNGDRADTLAILINSKLLINSKQ